MNKLTNRKETIRLDKLNKRSEKNMERQISDKKCVLELNEFKLDKTKSCDVTIHGQSETMTNERKLFMQDEINQEQFIQSQRKLQLARAMKIKLANEFAKDINISGANTYVSYARDNHYETAIATMEDRATMDFEDVMQKRSDRFNGVDEYDCHESCNEFIDPDNMLQNYGYCQYNPIKVSTCEQAIKIASNLEYANTNWGLKDIHIFKRYVDLKTEDKSICVIYTYYETVNKRLVVHEIRIWFLVSDKFKSNWYDNLREPKGFMFEKIETKKSNTNYSTLSEKLYNAEKTKLEQSIKDYKNQIENTKQSSRYEFDTNNIDINHYNLNISEFDSLMKDALRIAIGRNKISISTLQREFAIGFPRASKIIDQMLLVGFIERTPSNAPYKVLITHQDFAKIFGEQA